MEDKNDIYGKPYGFYKIEDLKKLESYRPRQFKEELISPCYDVCSAKLCMGKIKVGQIFEPVYLSVDPLPIRPFDQKTCQIHWIIIGYGENRLNRKQRKLRGTGI